MLTPPPPLGAAGISPGGFTGTERVIVAPYRGKHRRIWIAFAVAGSAVLLAIIALLIALVFVIGGEKAPEHGIRITLKALGSPTEDQMSEAADIVRRRVNALGIDNIEVTCEEERRVVVKMPGTEDTDRVLDIIVSTAQLQFREVLEAIAPGSENYETTEVTVPDPTDLEAYQALKNQEIVLEKKVDWSGEPQVVKLRLGPTRLTGDIIKTADAAVDEEAGGFKIVFELTDEASQSFADLTTELQGKNLAIVLDYRVESFPMVNSPITGGKAKITGDFTREEARDLALVLKLGALPVEFEPRPVVERY